MLQSFWQMCVCTAKSSSMNVKYCCMEAKKQALLPPPWASLQTSVHLVQDASHLIVWRANSLWQEAAEDPAGWGLHKRLGLIEQAVGQQLGFH